ncbi:MAG: glutamate--tRNA ligase [Candidatus Marinimicrobia bacterium]|nr:glutamate--tRNA ligase [Candidatus Neomarinimicrobiota bacterium]
MTVRVRFAPSPTGYLHVGGLRTALYNWLYARQLGGTFILRIEDTDQSREVEGAVEHLMATLKWIGLDVDEGPGIGGRYGPYIQSERLAIYQIHARMLLDKGQAYTCFCTPERLDQLRERQRNMGVASRYDRLCRSLPPDEARRRAASEPHVVRLAVPESGRIIMEDLIRKKVAVEWETVDDQVLLKGDGFPTYHLANVVDDHLMEVTHVIRGEEWLPSMPKHLLLYQAFGWEAPIFAHLPLLLNKDRSKLSKRQGHVAVEDYQTGGYLPEALVNFVALLGWHAQGNQEVFDREELTAAFELERVQKGGAIFDTDKLKWLNGQHIRRLSLPAFREAIAPHIDPDWDVTETLAAAVHTKVNLLTEVRDQLAFFFEDPVVYDEAAREALSGSEAAGILSALLTRLEQTTDFSGEWFLAEVKAMGQEFGLKGKPLWHPIRAAIAGRVTGPDIITIVETFGLQKCRERVQAALDRGPAGEGPTAT